MHSKAVSLWEAELHWHLLNTLPVSNAWRNEAVWVVKTVSMRNRHKTSEHPSVEGMGLRLGDTARHEI